MSTRTEDILTRLATVSEAVALGEAGLVDSKLARGLILAELWDWSKDAFAEAADELAIGLSTARQERWIALAFPAGNPRPYLGWSALRALAKFSEDDRETIIGRAEDLGQPTSEEVSRQARLESAARRGVAEDAPDADPITAVSRAAFMLARFEELLRADFAPDTIALIASAADRYAGEWEAAGGATIASVFGRMAVDADYVLTGLPKGATS